MNYKGVFKFAEKELREIYLEWSDKADLVKMMSYEFALRLFAGAETKDANLAVAIAAVAVAKLTGRPFCHDSLSAVCAEGYEAGFVVCDILAKCDCEVRSAAFYAALDKYKDKYSNVVPSACGSAVIAYNVSWEPLTVVCLESGVEAVATPPLDTAYGRPRRYQMPAGGAVYVNEYTREYILE